MQVTVKAPIWENGVEMHSDPHFTTSSSSPLDESDELIDFGAGKGHPGYVTQRDYENHGAGAYGMGSPPAIVGDVVVTTVSSRDSIQQANHGMVRGLLKWRTSTARSRSPLI